MVKTHKQQVSPCSSCPSYNNKDVAGCITCETKKKAYKIHVKIRTYKKKMRLKGVELS